MPDARQALFEALNVTSVINGVELRNTNYWPETSAPFCIILPTNTVPQTGSGFRLISPRLETSLNNAGVMRIDPFNADTITATDFSKTPDIAKILFRGSNSDLQLILRVRTEHATLGTLFNKISKRSGYPCQRSCRIDPVTIT